MPDKGTVSSEDNAVGQTVSTSKRRVTLSWKASPSLSSPPGDGEGYNLYRLNPDCSCVKLQTMLKGTINDDSSVERGQTYRYATTAVRQKQEKGNTSSLEESGPSNVVEVSVPPM
jgi:hypothetical protein